MTKTKISDLIPDDKNFNKGSEFGNGLIEKSFRKFGAGRSILIDKNNRIISGNKSVENAAAIGMEDVQIVESDGKRIIAVKRTDIDLDSPEGREMALADNATAKANIVFDAEMVEAELGEAVCVEWGVDVLPADNRITKQETNKKLFERFIVPPFSILDTRAGYWQDRKRLWLAMGLQSEAGRGENLNNPPATPDWATHTMTNMAPGTSIFDPVLCELIYAWFNIRGGCVLDPFAGGSVRGIMAAKLGMQYVGVDLRPEQIEANRINAHEVLDETDIQPVWHTGNSLDINQIAKRYEADLVFSCPPYADLETYSDLPGDISNMDYADFLKTYRLIITTACKHLKHDRFACFVVGDVRDKKGFYRNFVSDTIQAFQDNGAILYNEIVLINVAGTLPLRIAKQFTSGRKVGKCHQNVLVFYKGNPKNIKQNFPEINVSQYTENETE